jgi:hypothetical protein
LEHAQHHAFTRKCCAADAEEDVDKLAAMHVQFDSPHKVCSHARFEQSVTALASLVEECLDDMCARLKRAKRAGWRAPAQQIEFLPKGVLESAALEPYLKHWRRHETPPGTCAAPEPRARFAYLTMDLNVSQSLSACVHPSLSASCCPRWCKKINIIILL